VIKAASGTPTAEASAPAAEHSIGSASEPRAGADSPESPARPAGEWHGEAADAGEGETRDAEPAPTDASEAREPVHPGRPDTEGGQEGNASMLPDRVTIEHSGTGTVVRFPTPNGMVSDTHFAVLRKLGFRASRDKTQPRFFYLPSTWTLSRRERQVSQLRQWLEQGDGACLSRPLQLA